MADPQASDDRTTPSRLRTILLVVALTCLALALRLLGRGHESIWYDEAYSLRLAEKTASEMCSAGSADPGNPAGYFLLLKGWLLLFGATIESARAFSAVTGALSVPAVWLLAQACRLPQRVGFLAALLVALSPPLVYLGQEARVFALFATMATLAVACVTVIERKVITWAWPAFALLGAAMVHLHYYGVFVLVVLGLHLALWGWFHDRRVLWLLTASAVVVVAAFLPWLPVFRWQLQAGASRSSESWWQHLALMPLFDVAGRTLIWKEQGIGAVAGVALAIVALIFVPLLYQLRSPSGVSRSSLLIWWVVGLPLTVAVVSLKVPMIHSHYLSVVIPALLLLLAALLDAGWRQGPRRAVACPALALMLVTLGSLGRLYAVPHKDDWRGLAARTVHDGENLPVYCYEDIGADPFDYYRPGQPAHPLTEPFGDGSGWDPKGERQRMRYEPAGFWLILYLTDRERRSEEAAILTWLHDAFVVQTDEKIGRMRLMRCHPRSVE